MILKNITIYITTKRVLFLSQIKGFEVPLSKLTKLERNKDNKVSVNIYEGQKYYEVVTNEGDSARIALIYRLLSVLINDGRVSLL